MRWWLVGSEIVTIVLVATLAAAAIEYVSTRLFPERARPAIGVVILTVYLAFRSQQMVRFYWIDQVVHHDWNLSWSDESLRAAKWLEKNLPEDALIGSWNAGVLGYYSRRRVVNLDGLINNHEILPYLRRNRIDEYIVEQGITHLSAMQKMLQRKVGERLPLATRRAVGRARSSGEYWDGQ